MRETGCFAGSLYPDSGRTRWVSYWPPVPQLRPAHFCGVDAQRLLLAVYTSFGLAPTPLRHSKLPVGVPSGTAEAGDPYGSRFSPYLIEILWIGRAAPPSAEGRTASLAGSLYPKRSLRTEKIPATAGRSGQPPPTGWLRHSAVLVSPRRATDPHPLDVLLAASTLRLVRVARPTPPRRGGDAQRLLLAASTPNAACDPKKYLRPPVARASRCRSEPETGSLYPYKPIPEKSLPPRENRPRAGQAPRARGGLWAASAPNKYAAHR